MWQVFIDSFIGNKAYIKVLEGLAVTIVTAISALIIGIILGTIVALSRVFKSKNGFVKILQVIAKLYVGFFRGTPIVVQVLFIYFVIFPLIGLGLMNVIVVGIIIFGLNSGAYVSEIMRAGIMSVDKGQSEASRALGLTYSTTLFKVVLPQAIKNVIPTIANEFVSLLKETSVLSFIGIMDLYKALRQIGSDNYEYTIPYLVLAIIYLILVMIATSIVKVIETRLRRNER